MPYAHHGPVRIYYETFGEPGRPTLLLISGLGSQCIGYPEAFCERLAGRGFFVVRFDNRDVGLSTRFDGAAHNPVAVIDALRAGDEPDVAYRLADMADDAVAVLDALGVARAHVVGLSMGGMIVQQLAIDHADRLASLTSVMSTTGDLDVGHSSEDARRALNTRMPADRDDYVAQHLANNRVYGSPAHYDEQYLREVAARNYDRGYYPEGTARQLCAVIASGSRTAALRAVAVPALVVHGDADALIHVSGAHRTAEAIPGSRLEVIEGMGHDLPPALWDRIVELVAEHAGAHDPTQSR